VAALKRWLCRLGLAALLAGAVGYLPYRASGGIGRAMRLERQLSAVVDENLRLEQENQDLRRRIERLKNDKQAIERVARDELGLVHPDDLVFQTQ
jgi:cell division protein FtsB